MTIIGSSFSYLQNPLSREEMWVDSLLNAFEFVKKDRMICLLRTLNSVIQCLSKISNSLITP